MSYPTFEELVARVTDDIKLQDTNMRPSIPPEEAVALSIRYLASGCSLTDLHYRSHFSGAAERGTRGAGATLPRVMSAAMLACKVVMAYCWSLMVCLACWSSGWRLRGTTVVEALGVERGDRRGRGILTGVDVFRDLLVFQTLLLPLLTTDLS
ncbi:hypothetical protein O3P69_008881 [Scylla paramamosain]|uniref:Uncharacterized protein n=1 Tax=Scylla paramamosain TaxID=85552 RepID=A0AAW0TS98_SCYPA